MLQENVNFYISHLPIEANYITQQIFSVFVE